MESMNMWHEDSAVVRRKPGRVIVKKRNPDGSFHTAVSVPSERWPLAGPAEIFSYQNTKRLPQELDHLVDEVKYRVGFCYSNAAEVTEVFRKAGITAKAYVGWLFVGEAVFPVHHCWCVVNGNSVIDLADDFWLTAPSVLDAEGQGAAAVRRKIVESHIEVSELKNSQRCAPLGIPSPLMFYVGCPCEPEEGRRMFQSLIAKFPGHECLRRRDEKGRTETQRMLAERGYM